MAYYHNSTADTLARGLGWFSIGLGLTEVVAGRRLGRWLGMEEHAGLIRGYGVREIGAGIGLLAVGDPKPWMWGRVVGDALDLGTLAVGLGRDNPRRDNVGIAMAAVAGVTALDIACAQMLRGEGEPQGPPRNYSDRVGLARSPAEMRGAARNAPIGEDMRTPKMLQPLE
ncbi:cyclase dehydrase [Azospirillum sp. sgz301742]